MTAEEYFFDQIFSFAKENVEKHSLPFFNTESKQLPVELSTGKIINDTNLIALEQAASLKDYKSNLWIYGSELERLSNMGIPIKLKKGAEPVLCQTHFGNYERIVTDELNIAEGGAKTQNQFLYNYDSLTEESQRALDKLYSNSSQINEAATYANFQNFASNISKLKNELSSDFHSLQKTIQKRVENLSEDFNSAINAHAKHFCFEATGTLSKQASNNNEISCYTGLQNWIENTIQNKIPFWIAGEDFCRAMDAGTWYAKSFISKDFNHANRKQQEDNFHKKKNIARLNKDVER